MELIDLLTKNLGVSENQAQGGAGLLFKLAKDKLGAGDFSKVSAAVPGIDSLLNAAPAGGGGILGGVGKIFGGAGGLASLAGGFKNLGLDSSMVGKFVPIILQFVQSKGGDGVKTILEKVLK
jgi:hypothetical protein